MGDDLQRAREFVWNAKVPVGLGLFLLLYLLCIRPEPYAWGDNIHYVIVAKAIATGQGIRDVHVPGAPPFAYPIPLFPLLLAPIVRVSGDSLYPLQVFVTFTGVGALYLVYRLFREPLGESSAILLTLLTGVSPQIVSFSHQVMSEIPYLALSLAALLSVARYTAAGHWRSKVGMVAGVTLAAALLTRTVGVALVMASVGSILLEGNGRRTLRLQKAMLLGAIGLGLWYAANASVIGRARYIEEFRQGNVPGAERAGLVARVLSNARNYARGIPETVLYWTSDYQSRAVMAVLLLLIGVGFLRALITHRTAVEYYVAAYGAILLLYQPSTFGNLQRYLVPLIPFILCYFILGLRQLERAAALYLLEGAPPGRVGEGGRSRPYGWPVRTVATAVLSLLVLANGGETVRASLLGLRPEMFDFRYDWDRFEPMCRWARQHSAEGSVFATREMHFFHYFSRRLVVGLPDFTAGTEPAEFARLARAEGIQYFASDGLYPSPPDQRSLWTALEQDPRHFVAEYRDGPYRIYRIAEDGHETEP